MRPGRRRGLANPAAKPTIKAARSAPRPALRGAGPITYEQYTRNFTYCPPPLEANPYPAAVLWITDLRPVFDVEGTLVNFALVGVVPDPGSDPNRGSLSTEQEPGQPCRVIGFDPTDDQPDFWGFVFPGFHNRGYNSDSWVISSGQSYSANSVVTDAQAAGRTESTNMVLTVIQPSN
jgi:hypothetical protein